MWYFKCTSLLYSCLWWCVKLAWFSSAGLNSTPMGCNLLTLKGVLEHLKGCRTWVYLSTLGVLEYPQGVLHLMCCMPYWVFWNSAQKQLPYNSKRKKKGKLQDLKDYTGRKSKHACTTYNSMSNSFSHIMSSVLQSCKAAFGICCLSFISKIKCCTNIPTHFWVMQGMQC